MTITVITKSMGRRSFDSIMSISPNESGSELVINYLTAFTYKETIKISMSDIVGFYYGQLNLTKD